MKISTLAKHYVDSNKLASETKFHYRFVARLFVKDTKVTHVRDVNRQTVKEWSEKVMARQVEPSTLNNYLRHLRILLGFAVCEGLLSSNPIGTNHFEKVYRTRPKTVRITDLHSIMVYLDKKESIFQPHWFWKSVVRILFYTGMRRKQLVGLRWADIDFDEKKITFDPRSSKTKLSWEIPLTTPAINSLMQMRTETLRILGPNADVNERFVFDIRLFNSRYRCKNQLQLSTVTNFFNRLSQVTGIRISAHRLRHTVATQLAKEGKYKELQNLLGHSTMQTTMHYIHPELENIRDLISTLDQYNI